MVKEHQMDVRKARNVNFFFLECVRHLYPKGNASSSFVHVKKTKKKKDKPVDTKVSPKNENSSKKERKSAKNYPISLSPV